MKWETELFHQHIKSYLILKRFEISIACVSPDGEKLHYVSIFYGYTLYIMKIMQRSNIYPCCCCFFKKETYSRLRHIRYDLLSPIVGTLNYNFIISSMIYQFILSVILWEGGAINSTNINLLHIFIVQHKICVHTLGFAAKRAENIKIELSKTFW